MRVGKFFKWLVLIALAGLVAWAFTQHRVEVRALALHVLAKAEAAGNWGLVLYFASVALVVIFLLPGVILTLGAGFLYGIGKGIALFLAGQTAGACVAYAIGRGFLGSRARNWFFSHPKWGVLSESFSDEGWKFIALTRMTPFFPFKLSNYFFGAAGFRFLDFLRGTLVGSFPLAFVMVYLGSLIPNLTGLENRAWDAPWAGAVALGVGLFAVSGLIFMSHRAARTFRQKSSAWKTVNFPRN